VFIGAGRSDPIAPAVQVERLASMLRDAGADVAVHWQNAGHTVTKDELDAAQRWIAQRITSRAGGEHLR
jgi:phospholipase/carboxylesterase